MRIRCNRWAVLAVLALSAVQATAEEGSFGGYLGPGAGHAKPGSQDSPQPKPWEAKPWETKPWEAAQEELRPGVKKPMEESRRAGRKARKEQLENRNRKYSARGRIGGGKFRERRTNGAGTRWRARDIILEA